MTKKRDGKFQHHINHLSQVFDEHYSVASSGYNQSPEFQGSFAFTYDLIFPAEIDEQEEDEKVTFYAPLMKAA